MSQKTPKTLGEAAYFGNVPCMQDFIDAGVSLEERDEIAFTPLMRAAYDGQDISVRWLLEKGAKVDARCEEDWTPLAYAILNGHFDIACLLLDYGAKMQLQIGYRQRSTTEMAIEKLINVAASAGTWGKWQAHLAARVLSQTTPAARGSSPTPRM